MSNDAKSYAKRWATVEKEVEKDIQQKFAEIGESMLRELGTEGNSPLSTEKRNWLTVYAQMISWKSKCRELHGLLNPAEQLGKSGKAKGILSKENIRKKQATESMNKHRINKARRELKKKK